MQVFMKIYSRIMKLNQIFALHCFANDLYNKYIPPETVFTALIQLAVHPFPLLNMVSTLHFFFCQALLSFPFTVPYRIVYTEPDDLEMWPNHSQEFVILFNGCLDLYANIFICNVVLLRDSQYFSNIFSQSKRPAFFSLNLLSMFTTHMNTETWIRQGSASMLSVIQEPFVRAAVHCAILVPNVLKACYCSQLFAFYLDFPLDDVCAVYHGLLRTYLHL